MIDVAYGSGESAPKAGALPDCATPRLAEPLRFPAYLTQAQSAFRGKMRRNASRTNARITGIVPAAIALVALAFSTPAYAAKPHGVNGGAQWAHFGLLGAL